MKSFLRYFGIFFIIGGIFLYIIGGIVQDSNSGSRWESGVLINGNYTMTDSGIYGRDEKAIEEMGFVKLLGILMGVGGGIMFIASFAVKDENNTTITMNTVDPSSYTPPEVKRIFCTQCGQPGTTAQNECPYCRAPRKK